MAATSFERETRRGKPDCARLAQTRVFRVPAQMKLRERENPITHAKTRHRGSDLDDFASDDQAQDLTARATHTNHQLHHQSRERRLVGNAATDEPVTRIHRRRVDPDE